MGGDAVAAKNAERKRGRASCPWATARKKHPCFFLLIRFFKTSKEVRPPGFFEKIRNRPGARGSSTLTLGILRDNGAVDWVHDWAGEYDAYYYERRRWRWIEHELCAAAFRGDGELLRVCRWSECVGDVSGCEWFYGGSDFFGGVEYPKIAARHCWFERSGCSCEWAVSAWVGEQSVFDWRCGSADGDWRGGWVWDWAAEL